MHPKNQHQGRYDFQKLIRTTPELRDHVFTGKNGKESVDFDNPVSVRVLNKALMAHFYGIKNWEFPDQFLCAPIPSRADYIHYLADLFEEGESLRGLDIGVGANCVYPLLGVRSYGWTFVGCDIDAYALKSARTILMSNGLEEQIELRLQVKTGSIFNGIIKEGEHFDFSLCNPPFHASAEEASSARERKRRNLGLKKGKLNFGGRGHELWCEGGEKSFVSRMIQESGERPKAVRWYSTLVSKELNIPHFQKKLRGSSCKNVRVINMDHGNKKSRILAWSFLDT